MMLQGDASINMMINAHMLVRTVRNVHAEFSTVIRVKELAAVMLQ